MSSYTLSARLTADAKEFVKGIDNAKKEMKSLQKFSQDVGKKFQNFGKNITGIGDSLTNKITKPALVAAGAVAGITFTKGFQRLVAIDTAQAKLQALGHDAKNVDAIMDSALASVKGTAFGLGDAATAAASAVAAGIPIGRELTQYLTTVGDAAAIAGVEFTDMASIFNSVQTGGKATRMELNQLADRGLPIFQWLADAAGVSGDAIQEMVSKGEVNSELFNKAIEKNIGGAAQIMGEKSFTAAFANVGAAIGRLGANFLDAGGEGGGFFSKMKPLMTDFIERIDNMGDLATDWGIKFGEAIENIVNKVKEIKSQYDSLSPGVQDIIKKTALWGSISLIAIGPILKIIGPIISALGFLIPIIGKVVGGFKLLAPAVSLLSGPVGWIVGGIALLVGALIGLYNTSEVFRDTVNGAFNAVREVVMSVVGAVVGFVMELWGELVEWWHENNDLIMQTTDKVWGWISTVIESVMGFIAPFIEHHWQNILVTIQTVWEVIKFVVGAGMDIVLGVITSVMKVINGDWEGAWNSLNEMGTKIMERASDTLKNIFNILKDFVARRFGEMKNDSIAKYEELKQGIINRINSAKTNVVSKFQEMRSGIQTRVQGIVTTVQNKFNEARNKMLSPIESARDKIKGIIDKIKGFFSGLSLTIPKPKVPKFSLSGNFSLAPPSVPRISVNWNKDGGIFRNPTIFNTSNAGMQGVGEAGPEAILPLNRKTLAGIGRGIEGSMDRQVTQDNRTIYMTLDMSNINEMNKAIEIIKGFKQTVRQG